MPTTEFEDNKHEKKLHLHVIIEGGAKMVVRPFDVTNHLPRYNSLSENIKSQLQLNEGKGTLQKELTFERIKGQAEQTLHCPPKCPEL